MQEVERLELWGGFECTVARLGNVFRNQIAETGHSERIEDLDAVAALGIRTLRYPAIWEAVSPDHPDQVEWRWCDERFFRMRKLGITPIAGLLHHGSGPSYTSLLDPAFPELFARHAERVARRYPWVSMFTPVNEPLTTARFSALYGHWFPHARDNGTFLLALLNQCRAVVLAMRAIRQITPKAKLVQTEDLGCTFSTPALAGQACFENHRRWLSLDLLCGRVDNAHPMWRHLAENGLEEKLGFFLDNPYAPDIIGINHYPTSERFLDENLAGYPEHLHGANGQERYADVEAVRMHLAPEMLGPRARLDETWKRYHLPLAVTEVHHGCSREEQLRWLRDVWQAADGLRAEGADIRAVTVWALAGACDWNSLLTARTGFYEPGVYDVRAPRPRLTAIAHAARALAETGSFDHPVLDNEGWWRREEHRYHPRLPAAARRAGRLLLLTQADNPFGREMAAVCTHRGLDHVVIPAGALGAAERTTVEALLDRHRPWAVLDAGGPIERAGSPVPVGGLHSPANPARMVSVAEACGRRSIPVLAFSSPQVFDGKRKGPYVESDAFSPGCPWGGVQARAEELLLELHPSALLVRTGALFAASDRNNVILQVLRALAAGRLLQACGGTIVSPTFVPDLAHAALDLLIDGEKGIWHLVNAGTTSWLKLAELAAAETGLDWKAPAVPGPAEEAPPRMAALSSERGSIMPTLQSAVSRYLRETAGERKSVDEAA